MVLRPPPSGNSCTSAACAALRGVPINAKEAERQAFEAGRQSMQKGFAGTWDQLAIYLARG